MTLQHDTYRMEWPVLDTDRTRAELTAEAAPELRESIALLGRRPLAAASFTFTHKDGVKLVATVPVSAPIRPGLAVTA